MKEDFDEIGKRLPYNEDDDYVQKLVERCTENALAKRRRDRRIYVGLRNIAAVAVIAVVALGYLVGKKETAAPQPVTASAVAIECNVESVAKSKPLSDVLADMSDAQLASIPCYTTDDIPEY